ncbi:MAG TPA: hypothetical protein DCZ80_01135 [Legionellales bacterium]|nr:hypothetical protein [Legionellales bacterium]
MNKPAQSSSYLFKSFIILLFLINLCGLGWVYHLLDLKTLKLQNLESHLLRSQKEIDDLQNQNLKMQNDLLKKQAHSLQKQSLYQIEWLVRQAQWQLDVLGHVHLAKKYLSFAKAISQEQHWSILEENIHADIQKLNSIALTSSSKLVNTISNLQNRLEKKMQMQEKSIHLQPHTQNPNHPLLKTLEPFIKIERYQSNVQKVFTPNQVDDILKNSLALLPQIQFLGITHQDKVYQVLVQNLEKNIALLNFANDFQTDIQALKSYQFKLAEHVTLNSYATVEQLIKNEKSS